MKNTNWSNLLRVIGYALLGVFLGGVAFDCYEYFQGSLRFYTAPLYLYVGMRVLILLVPSVICIALSYILKKRHSA